MRSPVRFALASFGITGSAHPIAATDKQADYDLSKLDYLLRMLNSYILCILISGRLANKIAFIGFCDLIVKM